MQVFNDKIESRKAGVIITPLFLTETNFKRGEIRMATQTISKICFIDGCSKPLLAQQRCAYHYRQYRCKSGQFVRKHNFGVGKTREEKFWSKVDKTKGLGRDGDCWEWTGSRHKVDGYGQTSFKNKPIKAHQLAWIFIKGFKSSQWLLHFCDNPACVNPSHLREGTPKNNTDDRDSRGRAAIGERAGRAILTAIQVLEIRERCLRRGRSNRGNNSILALAKEFGVARTTIKAVVERQSWRCLL